jgi:hypothetical protein
MVFEDSCSIVPSLFVVVMVVVVVVVMVVVVVAVFCLSLF